MSSCYADPILTERDLCPRCEHYTLHEGPTCHVCASRAKFGYGGGEPRFEPRQASYRERRNDADDDPNTDWRDNEP